MKTVEELLLDTALYQEEKFTSDDIEVLYNLTNYNDTIDYYCTECKMNSTFVGEIPRDIHYPEGRIVESYSDRLLKRSKEDIHKSLINRTCYLKTKCTRNNRHKSVFIFRITDNTVTKIGQHPSIASLSQEGIKKYKKILSDEKYRELNKAVGLFSHGVGAGSLIYLRRIFEDLIKEAQKLSLSDDEWDNDKFKSARMDEKIQMLKNHLPSLLVEQKIIYGVLSKGIHELSEKECVELFPILKIGIELILNEKITRKEEAEKRKEFEKSLSAIHKDIKANEE